MDCSLKTKKSIASILASTFLFNGISEEYILSFIESCDVSEYAADEVIINSEQFTNRLAVVIQGKIAVKRHNTLLNMLSRGGVFGAASLFGGEKELYFTSVEAKTKAKILFISQEQIDKLLNEKPIAARNYIVFLTGRIRFLNDKISSFTSDSGTSKIAKYLLSFKSDSVEIKQSLTKLSESLDIGRATLYRAFEKLEQEKIVKRDNKSVRILDMERLKELDD